MNHKSDAKLRSKNRTAVSVCIPTFNAAGTLEKCLESILKQTVEPYEILIVDGYSKDDTLNIAQKYPKVRVAGFAQGIGKARKILAEKATGDIVAWVDADVVVPHNWLELHLRIHKESQDLMMLSGRPIEFRFISPKENLPNIPCEMKPVQVQEWPSLTQAACSVKKEVYSLVNYDERFRVGEEWDFATSAYQNGIKSAYCDGLFAFHIRRQTARRFRLRYTIYGGNYILFLKKYGLWYIRFDPKHFLHFVFRIAMIYAVPLSVVLSPFVLLAYPAAWCTYSLLGRKAAHPLVLITETMKGLGEHLHLLKIL